MCPPTRSAGRSPIPPHPPARTARPRQSGPVASPQAKVRFIKDCAAPLAAMVAIDSVLGLSPKAEAQLQAYGKVKLLAPEALQKALRVAASTAKQAFMLVCGGAGAVRDADRSFVQQFIAATLTVGAARMAAASGLSPKEVAKQAQTAALACGLDGKNKLDGINSAVRVAALATAQALARHHTPELAAIALQGRFAVDVQPCASVRPV